MNYLIYDKVVELCKEKGISQRQLQRDLNLSISTVSKWKTSAPRPDTLQAVADYFNVSTDYLTGRTKYRNKDHMLQSFDENIDLQNIINGDKEIPVDYCVQTDEGIILIESKAAAPKYIDPDTRELAEKIMNDDQLKRIMKYLEHASKTKVDVIYNMVKVMDNNE